jgi:hypothetical protein
MVASREELVWAEVLRLLKTHASLTYFQAVYEGWRENVSDNMFPCIYMEPDESREEPYTVPSRKRILFPIRIIAEINVSGNYDLQIIGDATTKGVINIANDIKSALAETPNLNGLCQSFTFPNTRYQMAAFPFRQVDITMMIELITTGAVR